MYFAIAYAFMQVGRSLFMLWALKDRSPANYRNFQRISVWFTLFSLFWLAGGLAEGDLRLGLWAVAVIIENIAPSVGFWTPRLGRSTTADWVVEGSHMAERCGLFIIIALGESILVTGAIFAAPEWTWMSKLAFFVAFLGSVAMWWIYFDSGAERGSDRIAHSADPGRLARLAYTYLRLPIVAGIIVTAVGDEFSLTHPADRADAGTAAAILGGPALYLAGTTLFRRAIAGRWPLSHVAGIVLLGLLLVIAPQTSLLTLAALATVVLIVVAVSETLGTRFLAAGARQ
jgi:low temperature requirement protein LtrA